MLFFRISTLLIFKKCGSRFDMDYSGLDCHSFPFIPGFLYPKIPFCQKLADKVLNQSAKCSNVFKQASPGSKDEP